MKAQQRSKPQCITIVNENKSIISTKEENQIWDLLSNHIYEKIISDYWLIAVTYGKIGRLEAEHTKIKLSVTFSQTKIENKK